MKKRGNWNEYKSRCTILYAEQQKFIDRFRTYSFFCSFVLIVYVVWYNSTIYNIGLLGAEIHEEHCEAWNVDD